MNSERLCYHVTIDQRSVLGGWKSEQTQLRSARSSSDDDDSLGLGQTCPPRSRARTIWTSIIACPVAPT